MVAARGNRRRAIAWLIVAALPLLTTCNLADPDYYFLEKPRTLLLFDGFRDNQNRWRPGATDGYDPSFSLPRDGGRFLVTGPRTFLISSHDENRLRGDLEILVSWEILSGEMSTIASGDVFDFRIVLASPASDTSTLFGPAVSFAIDPGTNSMELVISDSTDPGADHASVDVVTAALPMYGVLRIVALAHAGVPEISAWLTGPGTLETLSVSRQIPGGWGAEHLLAIQASAPSETHPRALERLVVMRARVPE
ncbi:MAG: hypothetical protein EA382_07690 [Spirochaetaceae bacterium]|nr:MAG: hypothetical protein EA382_07690 [Spirochaetaceae bacterium]